MIIILTHNDNNYGKAYDYIIKTYDTYYQTPAAWVTFVGPAAEPPVFFRDIL